MKFWWVNHKQTVKKELGGGYIWSPKANKLGHFNQGYYNLTLVRPGDVIFSYAHTLVRAVGIVESNCVASAIPDEFGRTGEQWNPDGYLVKIFWLELDRPMSPKTVIEQFQHLLPVKHSPLQQNGNGNQSIYLAEISVALGEMLLGLIARTNTDVIDGLDDVQTRMVTDAEEREIAAAPIKETEKTQLIKARIGQGIYRQRLLQIEKRCRLTGVSDIKFLIASHIKPWRLSDNLEKLDGNNGLLLSPHVDCLFDKGWLSFKNNGDVLWAVPPVTDPTVAIWRLSPSNVGSFNLEQKHYLDFHRDVIFKKRSA
jgi:putative restriction endonuclease